MAGISQRDQRMAAGRGAQERGLRQAPTPASRKAEGALLLWRATYAAAYCELLMVEEWDRSLARGSGLPPSINEHPFERARNHAAYVKHEAHIAELDADRLKGRPPQWWKNSLNVAPAPKQDGEVECGKALRL